jgi:hypothetical protein
LRAWFEPGLAQVVGQVDRREVGNISRLERVRARPIGMRARVCLIQQRDVIELAIADVDEAELQIAVGLRIGAVLADDTLVVLERRFVVADDEAILTHAVHQACAAG